MSAVSEAMSRNRKVTCERRCKALEAMVLDGSPSLLTARANKALS